MSQPPPYTESHSFVSDQSTQPWFPGQYLDVEFANIKKTLDAVLGNLKIIQNDSGGLQNGIVTIDTMTGTTVNPVTAWVQGVFYKVNDIVLQGGGVYVCLAAHSSTIFANDLAVKAWLLLFTITGETGSFSSLAGNIAINQMNGGTGASASTFWRGDGAWVQPSFASLSGSIAVNQMNGGTGADATKFWRGDGIWSALPGSFSGLANPAASIGLSAVNGAATTAMRSDAAPALSQAISPTWTGTHTWADAFGTVTLNTSSAVPQVQIERDATYNNENHAGLTVGSSSSPLKYLYLGYDTSIDAGFIQSINSTVAYKPLLLNPNGGNVGIGTTSPGLPLDVRGAAQAYALNGIGYVAPGVNGVVGNGVTDDTTAIQAILNAYNNIIIAPGTYLISSTLSKDLTGIGHCRIVGSGAYYSHFVAKSSFTGNPAIRITIPNGPANDYEIGGFSIVNQTQGLGAVYGFYLNGSGTAGGNTKSRVFDVVSSGFTFNFLQQSTRMVVWDRCAAWPEDNSGVQTSGEFGWYLFTASNNDFCGDTDFVSCQAVASNTGVCVSLTDQGATGAHINGIRFRGHTFYQAFIGLHVDLTGANSQSFDVWINEGCQFDGPITNYSISLEANASGTGIGNYNINGTYFSLANSGGHIKGRLTNGAKFNGLSICGNWLINNSSASVDIRGTNGTADGIVFCNNRNEGVDCAGSVVNYFENVGNVTAVGNTGFNTVSAGTVYVEVNNPTAGDYATVIGNNSGGCAGTAQSVSGGAQLTHTQVSGNQ